MTTNFIIDPNYGELKVALRSFLEAFDTEGEVIVKGNRNTIKKYHINGTAFTVKKFKKPNAFQSLVYRFIRKSKARRSYEYAQILSEKGINTPKPVAYLEQFSMGLKDSYYICEHLEYDFDFRVLNHNPKWPNRKEILQQITAFTFDLHEKGVHFLDHSPGNTLILDKGDGTYDFYLIDLNRMRFETLNFKQRMKNFRRLWLSKTMINIMATTYAVLYDTSEKETHHWMSYYARKFQRIKNAKKLRKRKRRRS